MTKTVYLYDQNTKEFTSKYDAQESPLEQGVFLVPTFSTKIIPNNQVSGKFNYFNGFSWELRDDTRGTWFDNLHNPVEIDDLTTIILPEWTRGIPPKNLAQIKEDKKSEIKAIFENESNNSVLALNINWVGGFDSAIKLDAARRLTESSGLTSVVFYDTNYIGHSLTLSDALQVVIAVAYSYQIQLAKKNIKFNLIANAPSEISVNNITW